MPTTDITDWGDAVFLALSNALNAFLVAIPLVIGALLIIIIGSLIAGLLARLTSEILRRVGADRPWDHPERRRRRTRQMARPPHLPGRCSERPGPDAGQ